jgi:hypothetical protein
MRTGLATPELVIAGFHSRRRKLSRLSSPPPGAAKRSGVSSLAGSRSSAVRVAGFRGRVCVSGNNAQRHHVLLRQVVGVVREHGLIEHLVSDVLTDADDDADALIPKEVAGERDQQARLLACGGRACGDRRRERGRAGIGDARARRRCRRPRLGLRSRRGRRPHRHRGRRRDGDAWTAQEGAGRERAAARRSVERHDRGRPARLPAPRHRPGDDEGCRRRLLACRRCG